MLRNKDQYNIIFFLLDDVDSSLNTVLMLNQMSIYMVIKS